MFHRAHQSRSALFTGPWQGSTPALRFYFPPDALLCLHTGLQASLTPCPVRWVQQAPRKTNHNYHALVITKLREQHCTTLLSYPARNSDICTFLCKIHQLKSQRVVGFKLTYVVKVEKRHFSHRINMTQTRCSVHLPILFVSPKMIQWGWSASPPALVNERKRNIRSHIVLGLTLPLASEPQDAASKIIQPNLHVLRTLQHVGLAHL